MYQKSLVIIKPDGVQRNLAGTIITRFENAGLSIHAMKFQQVSPEQSKKHYAEHVEKDFYQNVEEYITSAPVIVFVLGGMGAISTIRKIVGATEPASAAPGTIRGDFSHQPYPPKGDVVTPVRNLIHASATPEEAEAEIKLWFNENEVIDYAKITDSLLLF